jgi:hypothetical protein
MAETKIKAINKVIIMKRLILFLILCFLFSYVEAEVTINEAGWHLVSPGEISNHQLNDIFDTQSDIDSVWGWNGSAWIVKFRIEPSDNPFEELLFLESNKGYWVKTNGTVAVDGLQGSLNHYSELNLSDDSWRHLAGTPSQIDVIGFFGELPENSTVWAWKNNSWTVYTKGDSGDENSTGTGANQINDTYDKNFRNLRYLDAGDGFWIHLPETNSLQNSIVIFDRTISGVSLASLFIRIFGGSDVDYNTYTTTTSVVTSEEKILTTSQPSSIAVFPDQDGIVINYPGLEFDVIVDFTSLTFSVPIPAGATIALYDGDILLTSVILK